MTSFEPSNIIIFASKFVFLTTVFMAAISDFKTFTIPNKFSIIIVASFPVYFFATHGFIPLKGMLLTLHLTAFIIAFITGLVFWFLSMWGGGDVKLFAATSLWVGLRFFLGFVTIVILAGGFLALFTLLYHKIQKKEFNKTTNFNHPIPYGVAIAIGVLWFFKNDFLFFLP